MKGYTYTTSSGNKIDACSDCQERYRLPESGERGFRVNEIDDGADLYRDPYCFSCGKSINSGRSGEIPKNKRPAKEALAYILNKTKYDAFATVALSGGDTPNEDVYLTDDDDGNPIAKQVSHPDNADEVIDVRFMNGNRSLCEEIQDILSTCGIRSVILPPDDDDPDWVVTEVKDYNI